MNITGFRDIQTLHRGDRSSVFRAVRQADGQPVILKVPSGEVPLPAAKARVRHEHEVGWQLRGIPGVVAHLDLVELPWAPVLVLEDIGGRALAEVWKDRRPSVHEVITLGLSLAEALAQVHDRGVIHKDVNPSNIVVGPDGRDLRLIDFEIATTLPREARRLEAADRLEGTLEYLSPEQTGRMNCPVDPRTDLYSVGIVLFEGLAGRRPFESTDKNELVHFHIAKVPPAPLAAEDPLALALNALVAKLLAKAPEDRYQSARGLAADLRSLGALRRPEEAAGFVPGREDAADRLRIPSRLYGRDEEAGRLAEALRQASTGRPGLVLVTGAAGVGKSALVQEIQKPVAAARALSASGKFDQFARTVPYSAFLQAFTDLARRLAGEGADRTAAWKARLLEGAGSSAAVLIDLIPGLEWLLGAQPPAPVLAPQEAQNRFLHLLEVLVKSLAGADTPIVLFLDDLQWADPASLALLERLLGDASTRGLLILGAYRDQEVDAAHPLRLLEGRLAREGVPQTTLVLGPLGRETLTSLTADAFGASAAEAAGLAALLADKTGGNPFFYVQMLRHLDEQGLVALDPATRRWKWDLEAVRKLKVADNVVGLMTQRLATLDPASARLLAEAACLGADFRLEALAEVVGRTPAETAGLLAPALGDELIVPLDADYTVASDRGSDVDPAYAFHHDRIQQAAAELLGPADLADTHLRIGRVLARTGDQVFPVADHLNQAADLLTSAEDRLDLARWNHRAGRLAKESAALEAALSYLGRAWTLLEATGDPWTRQADLTFDLHLDLAEARAFAGDRDGALGLFRQAETRGPASRLATVHEALIHFHTNAGAFAEAYATARKALRPFGVALPPGFVPPVLIADLVRCRILFGRRKVAEVLDLPEVKDPKKLQAMRLLAATLKACYQIRPELCVANGFKLINMVLKYGNMADTGVAFMAGGGIFLGSILGRHDVGSEFGQLALSVIDKYANEKQRAEVSFIYGYFVHFWKHPAAEAEAYFRRAYESALLTGDTFHLGCAACTQVESAWIRGLSLDEVDQRAATARAVLTKVGAREPLGAVEAVERAAAAVRGQDIPNEQPFEAGLRTFDSLHFSHFHFLNQAAVAGFQGRWDRAWARALESEAFLPASVGMLHTVEHHFWKALAAAGHEGLALGRRRRVVASVLKKLGPWAADAPSNFEGRRRLLAAEALRLEGRTWETLRAYQEAAEELVAQGQQPLAALTRERCARFLQAQGHQELAHRQFWAAAAAWRAWGAEPLAQRLEAEFPHLETQRTRTAATLTRGGTRTTSTSGTSAHQDLDLATILKATRAMTKELRLDALLGRLVEIINESAGAQWGAILAPAGGGFVVEAEGQLGEPPLVLRRDPVSARADLSESVLRMVARTRESLVLDDASASTLFPGDPALAGTRSLLCAPVLHQGAPVAFLYLVNNLSRGAFTPQRLEVLHLLSSQAAISIENARHHEELEGKVEARTRDLNAARQTSDRLLLNILPPTIADELKARGQVLPKVHREATVLFTDFSGFTARARTMDPQDLIQTLGDVFSAFDDICLRHGLEKLKTIGDAYMAVAGLPERSPTHVVDACLAALEMQKFMESKKAAGLDWGLRVGLHTGEVIAGVIGKNKFAYDIWGDTVNVASRMESGGEVGRVNVSGEVWAVVEPWFTGEARGTLEAKNRGPLAMHFLTGLRPGAAERLPGILDRWRKTGQP